MKNDLTSLFLITEALTFDNEIPQPGMTISPESYLFNLDESRLFEIVLFSTVTFDESEIIIPLPSFGLMIKPEIFKLDALIVNTSPEFFPFKTVFVIKVILNVLLIVKLTSL